jgi:hypothetical protein
MFKQREIEYVEENRPDSGVIPDEERDLVSFICNDVYLYSYLLYCHTIKLYGQSL